MNDPPPMGWEAACRAGWAAEDRLRAQIREHLRINTELTSRCAAAEQRPGSAQTCDCAARVRESASRGSGSGFGDGDGDGSGSGDGVGFCSGGGEGSGYGSGDGGGDGVGSGYGSGYGG